MFGKLDQVHHEPIAHNTTIMKINARNQLGIRILNDTVEQSHFMMAAARSLSSSSMEESEVEQALNEFIAKDETSKQVDELLKKNQDVFNRADEVLANKDKFNPEKNAIAEQVLEQLDNTIKSLDQIKKAQNEHSLEVFKLFKDKSKYVSKEDVRQHFFPEQTKWFLIQRSALDASTLVKIDTGYSARSVKDIAFGHYTYLLGKDAYMHFYVGPGKMAGYYYEVAEKRIYFEFRFDLETGACEKNTPSYTDQYTRALQILTYVELAEIEVTIVAPGKTNNKTKKNGKMLNDHKYDVYVVDSTWNKMIIRDADFAVSGHFRLQACGPEHRDRKLIWIDPFLKHGYRRAPRARITHEQD